MVYLTTSLHPIHHIFFSAITLLPHSPCRTYSVEAKVTEPSTEDPQLPVWDWDPQGWEWDPPLEVSLASKQEPLSSSTSKQGSLRDQALDNVDFQPNVELPACLDQLKVKVTHVNSPGSFYVQLVQNNFQLKR